MGELAQASRIGVRHVEEALAEARIVWSGERVVSGEIDVIADENELAGGEVGADASGCVGHDPRLDAETGEDLGGGDDLPGGVTLVGVDAALHDSGRCTGEAAENEAAGVAFDGGPGEVRDLRVGDRDLAGQPIGKAAGSGAKDDGGPWPKGGALADEGGGALGLDKC